MSGLVNVLVIVAVAAVVITRQFGARRLDADRRWWLMPVILAVVALRDPGLIDAHHRTAASLLLAAELVIGLGIGAGWAWTTRIWAEPDGTVWTKSTRASMAVWAGGIILRAGLFGWGALLGLHQGSPALMLALAATLLVRSGVLVQRTRALAPVDGPLPAYGGGSPRPAWKERV
ncbi:DUF1453 family protein [Streptomyces sp. NRRL S-340]|uniref:DUF1453 family protein n=1 Tax=Streptomyces sp. NRRL S-340 TaxID=1463901 RepID=UPI0005695CB7|nr:DUF1453 family protein [Streptomyces sp. NRRL S-340]